MKSDLGKRNIPDQVSDCNDPCCKPSCVRCKWNNYAGCELVSEFNNRIKFPIAFGYAISVIFGLILTCRPC